MSRKRVIQLTSVIVVIAVSALAAHVTLARSSVRAGAGGPGTPPPGSGWTGVLPNGAPCSVGATVLFQTYTSAAAPSSNGCWSYIRPIDSPDNQSYYTCSYNGNNYGSGSYNIYDDTNSSHTSPTDVNFIKNTCHGGTTSLYGEFMADHSGSWTKVGSGSGVSVSYFLQELYTCDSCRDSASASVGVPVVNVNADTTSAQVNSDISAVCYSYPVYSGAYYMAIYADTSISSTKEGWINSALNSCYS